MKRPTTAAIVYPDRDLFDKWFAEHFPMPRTRAKRGHWNFKKKIACLGWFGARQNPEAPMPPNSLTSFHFTPLTPEALMKLGQE